MPPTWHCAHCERQCAPVSGNFVAVCGRTSRPSTASWCGTRRSPAGSRPRRGSDSWWSGSSSGGSRRSASQSRCTCRRRGTGCTCSGTCAPVSGNWSSCCGRTSRRSMRRRVAGGAVLREAGRDVVRDSWSSGSSAGGSPTHCAEVPAYLPPTWHCAARKRHVRSGQRELRRRAVVELGALSIASSCGTRRSPAGSRPRRGSDSWSPGSSSGGSRRTGRGPVYTCRRRGTGCTPAARARRSAGTSSSCCG